MSIEERTNQWLALIQDGVTVLVLEIQQQIIGFVSLCEFRDGEKGKLTGEISAIQNDTAGILKQRLTKLIVNNKEKVKLIDNYQRNMKVID